VLGGGAVPSAFLTVLFALLVSMVPARADDTSELVFYSRSVVSTLGPDFEIALGDRYSPSFIKQRRSLQQ
jgi:hypothetical protein